MNSSPLAFSVYGLTQTWDSSRWLDSFGSHAGHSTKEVWLGQGNTFRPVPGQKWVLIGTIAKQQEFEPIKGPADVASLAAFRLVDTTMPERSPEENLGTLCLNQSQRAGDDFANWTEVSWGVDGKTVPARVWEWADCWVGAILDWPEVAVVVLGHGFPPENVDLSTVRAENSTYGFDVAGPLGSYRTISNSLNAAFENDKIVRHPWPRHRDHDRLTHGH